jgi:hypothetical protein
LIYYKHDIRCLHSCGTEDLRLLDRAPFIPSVVRLTAGPQPLPKPILQIVRSSASSFNLRYHLVLLQGHPVSVYVFFLVFSSFVSFPLSFFIDVFHSAVSAKALTNPVSLLSFLVCKIFVSSLTPRLHFSHDRSNRSSPSFSTTRFQNFPDISDLLSEASKF